MTIPHRAIRRRKPREQQNGSRFQATTSSLIAEARGNIPYLSAGISAPNSHSGVYIRPRTPLYQPRPAVDGSSPVDGSPSSASSYVSRLSNISPMSASPLQVPIEELIVPGGGRPARKGAAMTMGFDLVPDLKGKVEAIDDGQKPHGPEPVEKPKVGFWSWTERGRTDERNREDEMVPPPTPPLERDGSDDEWEHVQAHSEEEDDELCIVGELELEQENDTKDKDRDKGSGKVPKAAEKPVSYASALIAH